MARYTLRKAGDGDWHPLYRLNREAMGGYVTDTWGRWDETEQWRLFLGRVFRGRMQVVEVDGETAGILEVTQDDHAVHVDNIELGEAFRGRGLGTEILRDIMADAADRGLAVELQVLRVNPARRLYERLGFAVAGETETHIQMRWLPGLEIEDHA